MNGDDNKAEEVVMRALAEQAGLPWPITKIVYDAIRAAGGEVVWWRPIAEAPRDGTRVLLLAKKDRTEWVSPCGNGETVIMGGDEALHRMETGQWDTEGTSRVGGGLEKTGVWLAGGGWFQPDEVTHFAILRGPQVKP